MARHAPYAGLTTVIDCFAVQHYRCFRFSILLVSQMASYLLYIVTGAILALMATRHLLVIRRALAKSEEHTHKLDILRAFDGKGLVWAETALCGAIFLFGLWMVLTAGLLFVASLLHSF
jgi:hypothetical protein